MRTLSQSKHSLCELKKRGCTSGLLTGDLKCVRSWLNRYCLWGNGKKPLQFNFSYGSISEKSLNCKTTKQVVVSIKALVLGVSHRYQ